MKRCIIFLFFLLVYSGWSATKVSVASGLWSSNATWSPSGVPACGDSVIISVGHTVTINSQQAYQGCGSKLVVVIRGTLFFQSGNKLRLPCNSKIYIFINGTLDSDGGGNSNQLELCGNSQWTGSMGRVSGPTCYPPNLPGCNSVLPVELVNFLVSRCTAGYCFKWQTLSEKGSAYFELQKSVDGVNYAPVKRIYTAVAGGNSSTLINYQTIDNDPSSGLSYYRLKQVNVDATFEFSNILVAESNSLHKTGIVLFPNPAQGAVNLTAEGISEGALVLITVYNQLGGKVTQLQTPARGEKIDCELNSDYKLPSGVYIVEATFESALIGRAKMSIQ